MRRPCIHSWHRWREAERPTDAAKFWAAYRYFWPLQLFLMVLMSLIGCVANGGAWWLLTIPPLQVFATVMGCVQLDARGKYPPKSMDAPERDLTHVFDRTCLKCGAMQFNASEAKSLSKAFRFDQEVRRREIQRLEENYLRRHKMWEQAQD